MHEIEVIFEDKDLLALNKPVGIVVHHDPHHTDGTIVDWLMKKYPKIKSVGDPERPGIVHRLDKETSGVLLVAKTQPAFEYFKKLFHDGGIKKTYLALVVGSVKSDSGVIDAPIARSTKHFEKRVVGGKQGRAREALTEYKVLERFGGSSDATVGATSYTLVEVSPKTGRTHQIRSHMAHIGHPVVCDKLYGGKRFVCPAGLARQFLHAQSILFVGPEDTKHEVEAPLAPDLSAALKVLRAGG